MAVQALDIYCWHQHQTGRSGMGWGSPPLATLVLALFTSLASLTPQMLFPVSDRWTPLAPSRPGFLKVSPLVSVAKPLPVTPALQLPVDLPDSTGPFNPLPFDQQDWWKHYLCSCVPYCCSVIPPQTAPGCIINANVKQQQRIIVLRLYEAWQSLGDSPDMSPQGRLGQQMGASVSLRTESSPTTSLCLFLVGLVVMQGADWAPHSCHGSFLFSLQGGEAVGYARAPPPLGKCLPAAPCCCQLPYSSVTSPPPFCEWWWGSSGVFGHGLLVPCRLCRIQVPNSSSASLMLHGLLTVLSPAACWALSSACSLHGSLTPQQFFCLGGGISHRWGRRCRLPSQSCSLCPETNAHCSALRIRKGVCHWPVQIWVWG